MKLHTIMYAGLTIVSILLTIMIEIRLLHPKLFLVLAPLFCALAMWLACRLMHADTIKIKKNLPPSKKSFIGAIVFSFYIAITCTPAIGLGNMHNHPFDDFRWLAASTSGIIFALALLNFLLTCSPATLNRIVKPFSWLWHLPARYFVAVFCLGMFAATNLISFAVFDHIPHVQDSIAQFFQAKIFTQGNITAPAPPIGEFFQYSTDNMVLADRWFSQYPPGHAALLTLGLLFGAPWIVNPLLASLSVILLFQAVREWDGENTARLSTVLFSVSPFILFMSASFMNHVSTVFFLLLFLLFLIKSKKGSSAAFACAAGFSLGMVINIRTGEGVAAGIVFGGCFCIWSLLSGRFRLMAAFACTLCAMTAALLAYNYATTGDPLLFGYQARWGKYHTIGFHAISVMENAPHTPYRATINLLRSSIALNQNLLEWPIPSLLPLAIFFTPFLLRKTAKDYLLISGALAIPAFYFFYFYQDLCLGPRFLYASVPCIIALSSKALFAINGSIASARRCSATHTKKALGVLIVCSIIFAMIVRVPHYWQYYSNAFWEVDDSFMRKAHSINIGNALIFIKVHGTNDVGLGSGFLHNTPHLNGPIIFAKDLGSRNHDLIKFFPGRKYYCAFRDANGNVTIQPLVFPFNQIE